MMHYRVDLRPFQATVRILDDAKFDPVLPIEVVPTEQKPAPGANTTSPSHEEATVPVDIQVPSVSSSSSSSAASFGAAGAALSLIHI